MKDNSSGCEYCHKQMTQEDINEDKVIWFYDGWYHRKCLREEDMKCRPDLYG